MARLPSLPAQVSGREMIIFCGGLYLVSVAVYPFVIDTPLGTDLLMAIVVGGPGLILLGGGYWLGRSEIRSETYSVVTKWCLGAICAVFFLLGLIELAAGLRDPVSNILILTALGSIAGFAAGVHDAQAKTRALELRETVEQLTTTNKRLEQFAYAASHDLQEPLRMVSTYLQLIEQRADDELSEETEEYLEFAVDGAERMREMIRGLLAYSSVKRDGKPMEPVDLEEIFENVLADLQRQIEESHAEIEASALPRVEGDAEQLRQVFQNLLENAIKYHGDEPPRITVTAEQNGSMCEISVQDEGIGIESEETERTFEVFERLHTHDEYSGSGIGLAICKRVIERHGGDIWIDSEPGEGTTFTFSLPTIRDQ